MTTTERILLKAAQHVIRHVKTMNGGVMPITLYQHIQIINRVSDELEQEDILNSIQQDESEHWVDEFLRELYKDE